MAETQGVTESHSVPDVEKILNKDKQGGEKDVVVQESDEVAAMHQESVAVSSVYARKVYIFNQIMNEHIGMTHWQYGLLFVAGLGWLIDNLWLQQVAVLLEQVGVEFDVEQAHTPFMTLALFLGLAVGASVWGVLADILGRRISFNVTLFIAGVFGLSCAGANSFVGLGGLIASRGFGLGGALPVDGMLFLEFIPGRRQHLLALLSVFWPVGQLIASLVGWGLITNYSCSSTKACREQAAAEGKPEFTHLGWRTGNYGWRYTCFAVGGLTLLCFVVRFFVFHIPESPKFLLAKGRDAEAIRALRDVAHRCGKDLPDDLLTVESLRSAAGQDGWMDENKTLHDSRDAKTPFGKIKNSYLGFMENAKTIDFKPSLSQLKPFYCTKAMGYTSTVLWLLWGFIGLAYPLFNSFIVLYLSSNSSNDNYIVYRNYVIVSVCGVPGSILAALLVDLPRSGRRGSMAVGTLLTGVFVFGFTGMSTANGSLVFSCIITFCQQIMYGVLYCYTPEAFPAPLRGTGDGIGAGLNRLFGIFAPIIKIYGSGPQGSKQNSIPLYVAGAIFIASALLMLTLRVETSGRTAL